MFDIEFIFLKIRGKSVGEKVQLKLLCPDDNKTRVDVEINLEEVDVQMPVDHSNVVNLTDDIKIIMKYPSLKEMSSFDDGGQVQSMFDMMKGCIHEVHDGETVHHRIDMSENDLDDFIDSMSSDHFEYLSNFFETMPKVRHVVKVKNPKTKKTGEVVLEGLENFFG